MDDEDDENPPNGAPVPEWVKEANMEFYKEAMNITLEKRTTEDLNLTLMASLIKSGDFIAIERLDGVDQIVDWGTGSRCGHTAVAMRDKEDKLWILEA